MPGAVAHLCAGDRRTDLEFVLEKTVHAQPIPLFRVVHEVGEIGPGSLGAIGAVAAITGTLLSSSPCAAARPMTPPGRKETPAISTLPVPSVRETNARVVVGAIGDKGKAVCAFQVLPAEKLVANPTRCQGS